MNGQVPLHIIVSCGDMLALSSDSCPVSMMALISEVLILVVVLLLMTWSPVNMLTQVWWGNQLHIDTDERHEVNNSLDFESNVMMSWSLDLRDLNHHKHLQTTIANLGFWKWMMFACCILHASKSGLWKCMMFACCKFPSYSRTAAASVFSSQVATMHSYGACQHEIRSLELMRLYG